MAGSEFRVSGSVVDDEGRVVPSARVLVWREQLRARTLLGEGTASEGGAYRVDYRLPEDAQTVRIVVEARSKRLREGLTSPPTAPEPFLRIDLQAEPDDTSEHASLLRAIHPLLDRLQLVDVVENDQHRDVSFLAQETGRSNEDVVRAVLAARLASAYDVPAVAFYAFLRLRIPAALPSPLLDATQGFTLVDPLVQRIALADLHPHARRADAHAAERRRREPRRCAARGPHYGDRLAAPVPARQATSWTSPTWWARAH